MLTAPGFRGRGLGDPLLREALRAAAQAWPGSDLRIGAQAHLHDYYARHGFGQVGEPYVEDGIPHIHMLRRHRGAEDAA